MVELVWLVTVKLVGPDGTMGALAVTRKVLKGGTENWDGRLA